MSYSPFADKSHSKRFELFTYLTLLGLWIFATAWNFSKAFHIDDTAYLEIAQWISQNPLRPMSGVLSWGSDFEPIHRTNQPPLYFYLMAGWAQLFGWSEISLHSLMAIFTLWAITEFYRLAVLATPTTPLLTTVFFSLCPIFVVGQNTMVDIPLLAIWLAFFRILLDPASGTTRRYCLCALLCTAAILIKYSSLVLLPAIGLHSYLTHRVKQLFWVLIPIVGLSLWSAFNIWEYGAAHLLGRSVVPRGILDYTQLSIAWVGILGGITPFAGLVFFCFLRVTKTAFFRFFWWALFAATVFTYTSVLGWFILSPESHAINLILRVSFLLSGSGLVVATFSLIKTRLRLAQFSTIDWLLVYWLTSTAAFLISVAPFMAARHVLLALPPLLLIVGRIFVSDTVAARWVTTATITTCILVSSLLASADRWYADVYRQFANTIAPLVVGTKSTVWFNSNLGWQWYARSASMRQFSSNVSQPRPQPGDLIAVTRNNCCSLPITGASQFEPITHWVTQRQTSIQRFALINMYASGPQPWGYSYQPLEYFDIFKVPTLTRD